MTHSTLTMAKCIVEYKHYNSSIRRVSKNQNVPRSTVHRWIQNDDTCSAITEKRKRYNKRKNAIKGEIMEFIEKTLCDRPFITMDSLASLIRQNHNVSFSGRTISRYCIPLRLVAMLCISSVWGSDSEEIMGN